MMKEFLNIIGILYPLAKAFSIAAVKLPVSTLTGNIRNLERDVSPVFRNARENIQSKGNIIEINTTEINSLLKILLMMIFFLFNQSPTSSLVNLILRYDNIKIINVRNIAIEEAYP